MLSVTDRRRIETMLTRALQEAQQGERYLPLRDDTTDTTTLAQCVEDANIMRLAALGELLSNLLEGKKMRGEYITQPLPPAYQKRLNRDRLGMMLVHFRHGAIHVNLLDPVIKDIKEEDAAAAVTMLREACDSMRDSDIRDTDQRTLFDALKTYLKDFDLCKAADFADTAKRETIIRDATHLREIRAMTLIQDAAFEKHRTQSRNISRSKAAREEGYEGLHLRNQLAHSYHLHGAQNGPILAQSPGAPSFSQMLERGRLKQEFGVSETLKPILFRQRFTKDAPLGSRFSGLMAAMLTDDGAASFNSIKRAILAMERSMNDTDLGAALSAPLDGFSAEQKHDVATALQVLERKPWDFVTLAQSVRTHFREFIARLQDETLKTSLGKAERNARIESNRKMPRPDVLDGIALDIAEQRSGNLLFEMIKDLLSTGRFDTISKSELATLRVLVEDFRATGQLPDAPEDLSLLCGFAHGLEGHLWASELMHPRLNLAIDMAGSPDDPRVATIYRDLCQKAPFSGFCTQDYSELAEQCRGLRSGQRPAEKWEDTLLYSLSDLCPGHAMEEQILNASINARPRRSHTSRIRPHAAERGIATAGWQTGA